MASSSIQNTHKENSWDIQAVSSETVVIMFDDTLITQTLFPHKISSLVERVQDAQGYEVGEWYYFYLCLIFDHALD